MVEVITPVKKYVFENITAFFAPGKLGSFEVLPGHAALISEIVVGVIRLKSKGDTEQIAVSTGYAEVNNDKIRVLVESAETADEIDVNRAEAARKRAEERLKNKTPEIEIDRAEFALKKAINRLKLKSH